MIILYTSYIIFSDSLDVPFGFCKILENFIKEPFLICFLHGWWGKNICNSSCSKTVHLAVTGAAPTHKQSHKQLKFNKINYVYGYFLITYL